MEAIKPQDIRIGNYLYDGEFLKTLYEVTAVAPKTIRVRYKTLSGKYIRASLPIRYVKPIPLSEQRLIELGFVTLDEIDNHRYIISPSVWEVCVMKDFFVIVHDTGDPRVNGILVKYVHEVQNFYSLTGQELTFKE